MAGLLEWLQTPAGIGLLSGVAGYAANARRSTPINNVGRGAVSGLMGYSNAQDQLRADEENAFAKRYKEMQMADMERQIADRNAYKAAFTPDTRQPYQADNPFGENLGNLQTGSAPTFAGQEIDPKLAAIAPFLEPKEMYTAMAGGNNDLFGKVMPHNYTPESLARYQQSRNFADLQPVVGNASFGNVNPGQFTPESLATYQQTGNYADLVPFRAPTVINRGGQIDVLDSGRGTVQSLPVTPKVTDMPEFQAAQETAKATAKAGVEKATADTTKQVKANNVLDLIAQAEGVIDKASGSKAGALLSYGKQALGVSDEKTQANQQLKLISGWMVANVPRMEGPQSNFDVQNYREMAGMVGDESIPIADRKAALKQLRELQGRYAENGQPLDAEQQYIKKRRAAGVPDSQIAKEMTASRNAAKPAATFDLPPSAKQYDGKTLRDTKSGKRFKSVGGKWQEVK